MKAYRSFCTVMDWIYKICQFVAVVLLAATMTLLFVQTFMRYAFNYSLSWAEELARYMCIWMAFLGSGIGIRDNIHVGFDLLKNKLPDSIKPFWNTILNAAVFFGSFVLIKGGIAFVKQTANQTSSSLGLSMKYVYLSLLVGAVLFALFSVEAILKQYVKEE